MADRDARGYLTRKVIETLHVQRKQIIPSGADDGANSTIIPGN
jgi:hypothetical protein